MVRTTSPDPHPHASPRTLSRVLPSLARQIACHGVNRLSCQCEACLRIALLCKLRANNTDLGIINNGISLNHGTDDIIIIIIITVFIVRGLQDWPMAHYNCSYGVEMHVKIEKNKIK